ncbi:MAG TPA: type II toxin-antitoxin system RelE/ParE family toxin [Candidatus Nanoarchaeia archaeon]|nr:type II toxin-antitoxin system RelE/ParE family toxin [Candidatus Nanoarchaeia archaeon]
MYSVELSQKAAKFLDKLDKQTGNRIKDKLKTLANNSVPSDSKFITRESNDKIFRIRIGDFRALYKIKEKDKIILVANIDKRPKVYG